MTCLIAAEVETPAKPWMRWTRIIVSTVALLMLMSCSQNMEELDPDQPVPPPPPPLAQQFSSSSQATPPASSDAPASPQENFGVDRGIPPGITGEIQLEAGFADKIEPGAVLYIIARKPGGPPVAARRIDHPTFPVRFFLGQESIMFQGQSLEGQIDLSARIAQRGVAGPAEPGDLSGQCPDNPITIGNSTQFTIVLDTLH